MLTVRHDCMQGSQDWFDLHLGVLSASNVEHILTPKQLKVSDSDTSDLLACQLACERIYQYPTDITEMFRNKFTDRGLIEEPLALAEYSRIKNVQVQSIGFVTSEFERNGLKFTLGASPDAETIDKKVIQEVKSVQNRVQFKTLLNSQPKNTHRLQTQTQLLVTGAAACDFISYSNGLPAYINRVHADFDVQQKILEAAESLERKILSYIEDYIKKTKSMTPTKRRDYSEMFEIRV